MTRKVSFAVVVALLTVCVLASIVHTEDEEDTFETNEVTQRKKSTASGDCGKSVTWEFDGGVLTISGTGQMNNYSSISDLPWYGYYESISTVRIESGVTELGTKAFSGLDSLTEVSIPNGVVIIHEDAFFRCNILPSVTIPASVKTICSYAFYGCEGLTEVNILAGELEAIEEFAFAKCTKLQSFQIPTSLTRIGYKTFYNCQSLKSISIPASVSLIGQAAFSSCPELSSIIVADDNDQYISINGALFTKSLSSFIQYPAGKRDTTYTIPEGVSFIFECGFEECNSLTTITIPSSVTSVGARAFAECNNLKTLRYLGTQTFTSSEVLSGNDLTDVCVPPDFSSTTFCGVGITPNTETCQSFRSLFNQCYTATIQDGVLRQVKRQNATEWESRSKGCLHYECDNDIGGWINKTCARGQACYVGKCDEVTGDCSSNKVEGYDELEKQVNQCYEIECDESKNEWELVKRANASAWENKSNGCKRYECNNESGGISTPLKTCSEGPACYNRNGKCNESDGECVYEKVEGYEEVEKGVNECYEVMCDEGNNEWVLRKRANASEWESRSDSDGCYEYHCDNESGFVRWSKCNNSVGVTRRCVNGECVEEKSTSSEEEEKGWTVEIDFGEMDVSELNESEVKEQISSLTGIDADELKVVVEIDRDGNKVRVIVYVKDEESANNIASKLNNIDKGDECPYGVLCRARTVRVVEVQVISCGYKLKENVIGMIMMVIFVFHWGKL